ncbi:uncharacterized protein K452DRAFT_145202 [Aplosporella prunicola CBS 121167]|uniref:Uncharacterized protein n=1 Tax=Aplosporella prunicola CBS 121167 TaxID=1176127 RepID=A0A6A6BLU5_9PEZI|nr:uncharacterized protein K452DRAFT_145202 [Aplosporella prunicola CBS 121167]KAF2144658.1 hypothetical protein K452DRAFT_145202 [Aplosporella prunicola CBS 121167]
MRAAWLTVDDCSQSTTASPRSPMAAAVPLPRLAQRLAIVMQAAVQPDEAASTQRRRHAERRTAGAERRDAAEQRCNVARREVARAWQRPPELAMKGLTVVTGDDGRRFLVSVDPLSVAVCAKRCGILFSWQPSPRCLPLLPTDSLSRLSRSCPRPPPPPPVTTSEQSGALSVVIGAPFFISPCQCTPRVWR